MPKTKSISYSLKRVVNDGDYGSVSVGLEETIELGPKDDENKSREELIAKVDKRFSKLLKDTAKKLKNGKI